jgi:hypothetical protein
MPVSLEPVRISIATPKNHIFIRDLQRKFDDFIGFIPDEATERELNAGNILMGMINDDDAGFLFVKRSLTSQPSTAAIIQAAVRMDAQRQRVGLELVKKIEDEAIAQGRTILQAACRADLEANSFWKAAGFVAVATKAGGKKFHTEVILWRKALSEGIDIQILPSDVLSFQGRHSLRGPGAKFATRENATPYILRPNTDAISNAGNAGPFNER